MALIDPAIPHSNGPLILTPAHVQIPETMFRHWYKEPKRPRPYVDQAFTKPFPLVRFSDRVLDMTERGVRKHETNNIHMRL